MDSNTPPKEGTELVRKSFLTEITATVLMLLGLLAFLGVFSFEEPAKGAEIQNIVGAFGHFGARTLLSVFGGAAYLLGPYLIATGLIYIKRARVEEPLLRAVAAVVLLIAFAVVLYLMQGVNPENFASGGGVVGRRFGHALQASFGFYGALILAIGTLGTGALLATRLPATELLDRFRDLFERQTLIVRQPRPPAPAPAPPALPTAEAPRAAPPRSDTLGPLQQPPLLEFERSGAETRPWFTRIDMPGARGPANLGIPEPSDRPAPAHDASQGDADDGVPTRPPLIRRFEPAARTASLTSMLRDLGRRQAEPSAEFAGVGPEVQTVLAGVFTDDGRRYLMGRERSPSAGNTASFAPRTARSHFASASPPEAAPTRESRSPSEGVPLLRPVRIRVSSSTFADTGRAPTGRSSPALELPSAESLGALAVGPSVPLPSAFATGLDIPEIEAMDDLIAPPPPRPGMEPAAEIETTSARGFDTEFEADPEADLVDEFAHESALASDADQEDEPEELAPVEDDQTESAAAEVDSTAAALGDSIKLARAALPATDFRGGTGAVPQSGVPSIRLKHRPYRIPTEILNPPFPVSKADTAAEIALTRQRLEQVLRDYGIQGKVVREQRGPIVTLFEIKLEPGVKVSRILGISDEIKMNLEAASVRILAPMPGRSTIGIEIPNRSRETVVLGDVIRRDESFFSGRRELTIVLGKDIAGHNQYVDLTTLPHLLMAGATGSGKSVYLNTVIASLLYTRSPEDVRFIMIDPKMVELTLFEGIPHLLMPVITDVRMASKALAWVVGEMERRYAMLSNLRCRDIRSYNERTTDRADRERLPYLVVLIDELSDLMMVAAKDVEDSIIRLTQKARAVGIHVIMATQRPSVDVITALIKANCPARIAFQVAQRTDSRTILDANGAEALVGRGDMLYKSPSASGLRRVQALLITEDEIERIVAEARRFGEPEFVQLALDADERRDGDLLDADADEDMFDEAWAIVLESGKTSTSYIQRRLRIGYNRAARLIEMMEERGYLGPAIGTRPREVLKKA